jgi:hypothetical protein
MKSLSILAVALVCLTFVGCELASHAPPRVSAAMVKPGEKHVDVATLQKGRALFVHRCIECHTLPPFWHYRSEDWPPILDSMAHRAHLKPGEREAILAYILAIR